MEITLDKIVKSYSNNSNVLDNISLTLSHSDSIAVIGPSGCGKSTLLNLIGTLDKPSSGNIFIDNQNISNFNEKQLAHIRNQQIGFVFQMHHLLPQLTLFENVLVPTLVINDKNKKNLLRDRAMHLLSSVGLQNKINQFPGQLSGGECQRTAVVRALINEPKILLADEPTGSLDQESAEQIGNLLTQIHNQQQIGLVIVTHSMELASKMKVKYQIINGKLILHSYSKTLF